MITKGTKTKFILLKGLGLHFKNVLHFVQHVHIKHLHNYIGNKNKWNSDIKNSIKNVLNIHYIVLGMSDDESYS